MLLIWDAVANNRMLPDLLPNSLFMRRYSRSKSAVELRGSILLHRLRDMGVQVECHPYRGVPKTLLRNFRMHASREKLGRVTVSQIVESDARHALCPTKCPFAKVVTGLV